MKRSMKRKAQRMIFRTTGAAFVAMLVSGAGFAGELSLDDFWVRAMPPVAKSTAAYGRITNLGDTATVITGASAAFAGKAELHETRTEAGMAKMVAVMPMRLAPGESRTLAPGGLHLMLMQLARVPSSGEVVTICLQLEGGDEACTDATVRKSATETHDHSTMKHHD
jgi:copper(I)-binding protein